MARKKIKVPSLNEMKKKFSGQMCIRDSNRLVPERKLNMKLLTRLTNPQLSILLENMRLGDGRSIWASGDKTQGELLQALEMCIRDR